MPSAIDICSQSMAPEQIAGPVNPCSRTVAQIAAELAEADRNHSVIPRITSRYPESTVEDSYAIQGVWRDKNIAAGRRLVGRKIGLTSKAMQQATGITEPDYGVILDDQVFDSGATLDFDAYFLGTWTFEWSMPETALGPAGDITGTTVADQLGAFKTVVVGIVLAP